MSVVRTMVDVSNSVTTLWEAFFARVEMDTAWMKMDAGVMVKPGVMVNNGSISVQKLSFWKVLLIIEWVLRDFMPFFFLHVNWELIWSIITPQVAYTLRVSWAQCVCHVLWLCMDFSLEYAYLHVWFESMHLPNELCWLFSKANSCHKSLSIRN